MIKGVRISASFRRPRFIINFFFHGIFLAFVVRRVFYWLPLDATGDRLNFWAFSDWLIDYSAGFTRRGLSGEIIHLLSSISQPRMIVAVLSWLIFLAVVLGYLRLLWPSLKANHPLTTVGMLSLPSLFLFYIYDHDAFARKELIGYAVLLWHLLVLQKAFPASAGPPPAQADSHKYFRGILPIAVIAFPAMILMHEASFLQFIPIHALITFSVLRTESPAGIDRPEYRAALFYLPAALAFAAAYLFGQPTLTDAQAICQRWETLRVLEAGACVISGSDLLVALPGAFGTLAWSPSKAALFSLGLSPAAMGEWLAVFLLLGLSLWYVVRNTVHSVIHSQFPSESTPQSAGFYARIFGVRYFLLPFLVSLPVYIMGWDLGRWFAITSINFAMVGASVDLQSREFRFFTRRRADESPSNATNRKSDNPYVFYFLSIAICVITLLVRLPHCCITLEKIFPGALPSFLQPFFPP